MILEKYIDTPLYDDKFYSKSIIMSYYSMGEPTQRRFAHMASRKFNPLWNPNYGGNCRLMSSKIDDAQEDIVVDMKFTMENYHIPVLLEECCQYLNITAGKLYVDCTLGGGGHTQAILERGGLVVAFDQDKDAIAFASRRLKSYIDDRKLEIIPSNFRSIEKSIRETSELAKGRLVDGILMDLGVSSYQIDVGSRGFSFGVDGPLDMRMNQQSLAEKSAITASFVLNTYSVGDIADILYQYGEETKSRQIAREIVLARPLNTTQQLVEAISRITPWKSRAKTLARCFQALRIYINDELGALKQSLSAMNRILNPGGRLVVMSYHSLEDRLVKNLFKYGDFEGSGDDSSSSSHWRILTKKAVVADSEEISKNRRSRSAKLRAAEYRESIEPELSKTIQKYGKVMGKKQQMKLSREDDKV